MSTMTDPSRKRLLHIDPYGPWRRVIFGGLSFIALLAFGTTGYILIEGWSFQDALYMTITTTTTVGFREVHSLSGNGQLFTIFVILFGVGVALYILTTVVQTVVEGELAEALGERRMKARIAGLRNHYILCGFGRVGEEIAREFTERNVAFVIVENNPEAVARGHRHGYLLIEGDATQDEILHEAGIQQARVLMAASDSDAGNTYITLTAKALRPDIYVVARVAQATSESRALRAGADRVVSPYSLAGRRMALSALQPLTVDFMDLLASDRGSDQMLAELVVSEDAVIANQPANQAIHRADSTTLLAIQHENGDLMVGPFDAYTLKPGDRLMLLSNEPDMELLGQTQTLGPPAAGDSGA